MRTLTLIFLLLVALPATAAPALFDAGDPGPAVLSPDGTLLATGGAAKVVRLWDLRTGRLVREMKGPGPPVTERSLGADSSYKVEDRVQTLAFDPQGERLVASGEDGFVRLWSVPDGRLLKELEDGYEVRQASFSPSTDLVAYINNSTRDFESSLALWDLGTGQRSFPGGGQPHEGTVGGFRFAADGKEILSWGNGTARVWDVGTGEMAEDLALPEVGSGDLTPDGRTLALGGPGRVRVWDRKARRFVRTLVTHNPEPASVLAWSPGGEFLAGQVGDWVVVWEAGGRRCFARPVRRLLGWMPDRTLAVQARQGHVEWLGARDGRPGRRAPGTRP